MTSPARLRYQTIEFGTTDIHLCTLRDKQQFSDPDGKADKLGICSASWPMFGVIWPSSMVLANHLVDIDTKGKRILEVGCGMGLSSLLLNKQNENITATDHHPEAGAFLERNARLNNDSQIDYERVGWSDTEDHLGQFDLIIGSDLLYEEQHIKLLSTFIEKHARPECEVVIIDPGRGRKNKFSLIMSRYGFSSAHIKPVHTDFLEEPFKGHILKFWRKA